MAIINEVKIAGTTGEMQAEPRVFAHDARDLTVPTTGADSYVDVLPTGVPAVGDEVTVLSRGACLYVGGAGNVDVEMESGTRVLFVGVAAGAFLPVLVTKVYGTDSLSAATTTATDILALF